METEIKQGTVEWLKMKAGKLSSARIALALGRTKSGWKASRKNLCHEIAIERLTGICAESFVSGPMQWGKDHEAEARAAYEFETGGKVDEVAFVDHPEIDMAGCSPDGFVRGLTDSGPGMVRLGLIEIKCPNSATHVDFLMTGEIDPKYITQMQWQMACTNAPWCDFVSYDPRMPEGLQTRIERVYRDDDAIAVLESKAKEFIAEVDRLEEKLRSLRGDKEQ